MGVEPPARQFKLQFIPLQSERYFLLCGADRIATPVMQQALALLRSDALRDAVNALPGYSVDKLGAILTLDEAMPALLDKRPTKVRPVR
jgi:molybdate-binding protein